MLGARHRLSGDAAVLLGFAVLTVAMTWPLAQHLDTHVIRAKWFYDSMVNLQILGSRVHYALGVSEGLKSPYDNYFVAPTQFSVANNENHYVLAMLWAPFYLATSDPLLAYNLLLLTCMSLSGFFTYLLVRHLSGSALAGILSGVGFAFSPYIFFELGRIQLVAAQFIPLFALFLHDATRTGRWRSMAGLGLTFAVQVGCCLYYAVFLALYALFVGTWLVLRHRPPIRPLLLRATLTGLLTAIPVASMLYPYFRARQDFPLTRSEQVTADYAGRLADFAQVYRDNKALTFMRNNAEGPTEPIAFPGFTLLFLATVAVVVPVVDNLRRANRQARMMHLRNLVLLVVSMASAIAISYAARDLLPGLILLGVAGVLWRHGTSERLAPPSTFTHLCMLVLAVVLFLGPRPFAIHGEQMRGPYQYLYQHVPGLNGIRYVSRFVVLIMLSLAVLAGYGAALLLRGGRAWRGLGFAVLLAAMLYELRNAPMALADLPHQAHLPPVYRWLSEHPGPEPIATVPAYTLGYFGARNDYAALFHHRRTIEGKSSWMPPVTYAFIFESRRFPRDSMLRMLHALGAKYLVVRSSEYRPPERGRRIAEFMRNRSDEFPLRFESGGDRVYEVLPSNDRSTSLLSTSPIPRGAKPLDKHALRGTASMAQIDAAKAFDGNPQSCWRTLSEQAAGDWFEIRLPGKRTVAAIEVDDFVDAFDAPAAFELSVPEADGSYRAVFVRPRLRFYRDQVYHPKSFAFRVVLPQPVLTDAIRIELLDGVAGHAWSMHEAKVFVTD